MKILIISKEFTPVSNGTVTCLENIVHLIAKENEVIIYSTKANFWNKGIENIQNYIVKRPSSVVDNILGVKDYLVSKIRNKISNKVIRNLIINMIYKMFLKIDIISEKNGYRYRSAWSKNIPKFIMNIENLNEFDYIFAISNPYENVKAAMEIVSNFPNLKFIFIQFDLHAYNPVKIKNQYYNVNEFEERLNEEIYWYEVAKNIIITKEMEDIVNNSELNRFRFKTLPLEIPVLMDGSNINTKSIIKRKDINLIYTGSFYKSIRNPKFMLEVLFNVTKIDKNIKIHIFGVGCSELLHDYKKKMKRNIFIHGHKSRKKVIFARKKSNILLNLSNQTVSQAPSKIIEYIGTCKPIINFYSVDNDACKDILKEYQYSISIKEDWNNIENIARQVYQFIIENKDVNYDFEDIKSKYYNYLPEVFSNKIIEILKI